MGDTIRAGRDITEALIDAGKELLEQLDRSGLVVLAALWRFMPEDNRWTLIIASPDATTEGRPKVRRRVRAAIETMANPKLHMDDITVDSERLKVVQLLELALKLENVMGTITLEDADINGVKMSVVIYRLPQLYDEQMERRNGESGA